VKISSKTFRGAWTLAPGILILAICLGIQERAEAKKAEKMHPKITEDAMILEWDLGIPGYPVAPAVINCKSYCGMGTIRETRTDSIEYAGLEMGFYRIFSDGRPWTAEEETWDYSELLDITYSVNFRAYKDEMSAGEDKLEIEFKYLPTTPDYWVPLHVFDVFRDNLRDGEGHVVKYQKGWGTPWTTPDEDPPNGNTCVRPNYTPTPLCIESCCDSRTCGVEFDKVEVQNGMTEEQSRAQVRHEIETGRMIIKKFKLNHWQQECRCCKPCTDNTKHRFFYTATWTCPMNSSVNLSELGADYVADYIEKKLGVSVPGAVREGGEDAAKAILEWLNEKILDEDQTFDVLLLDAYTLEKEAVKETDYVYTACQAEGCQSTCP